MSGVIDDKGQQWERCHTCGEFVKFPQNLGYTKNHERHICIECVQKLPPEQVQAIIPAPSWVPVFES